MLLTQRTTKISRENLKTTSGEYAVKVMQDLMDKEKQNYKYDEKTKENIYNVSRQRVRKGENYG